MDQGYLNKVIEALKMSLQPSQELIDKARNMLENELPQQGPLPAALMQIAVDSNVEHSIRQSGAVLLTSEIKYKWNERKNYKTGETEFSYNEETKQLLRTSFLQGMTLCNDRKVLILLGEALWQLLACDKSPELQSCDDQILKIMTSDPSKEKVFSMLVAYEAACRSRRYLVNDKRKIINESAAKFMPVLLNLTSNLLKEANEINALMIRWIMQIYAKIVRLDLPPYFRDQENDKQWMTALTKAIHYCVQGIKSISGNMETDDVQEHSYSKSLGEIFSIFQRYVFRYAAKDLKNHRDFCENWNQNYSIQVWELLIEILKHRKDLKLENHIICVLVRNLAYCIELPKIAKTRFEEICQLASTELFEIIKFNEDDKEVFEDNPVEFIRRNQEECLKLGRQMESMNYIIHAIEDVSQDKNAFYTYLMKFVKSKLDDANANIIEVEACLLIAERIDLAIKQNDGVEAYNYFLSKASALLSNEHDFVKFRACKLISKMAYQSLKDQQLLEGISQGVTSLMKHDSLVIRSAAAQAMQILLTIPILKDYYKTHLKDILLVYIKIVNEYESDSLIKSFEMIFQIYQDEIVPFAVDLINSLKELFYKLMQKNIEYNKKDDHEGMLESSAASMCCLEAIQQIIKAPINQEILEKIFPVIQELLKYGFDPQNFEFFIDAVNIFNVFLMKFKGNIPDGLWSVLPIFGYYVTGVEDRGKMDIPDWVSPQMKEIFIEMDTGGDAGAESFDGFMPVFRNFVSGSSPEDMLNRRAFKGESFLELILNTCKITIERTILSTYENQIAHSLLLTSFIIFHLGKNLSSTKMTQNDQKTYLEDILDINFTVIQKKNTNSMRYCLINTVGVALYTDAVYTLEFMSNRGYLNDFFSLWPEAHKRAPTYTTRKGSFLGLIRLICLDEAKLKQLPIKLDVIFDLLVADLPKMVDELECVLSGEDKFIDPMDQDDMLAQFDFGLVDKKIDETFEEIQQMKEGTRPEFDEDAFLTISEIDNVTDIYDKIDDVNEVHLFRDAMMQIKGNGGELATYLDSGLSAESKGVIEAQLKKMDEIVAKHKK